MNKSIKEDTEYHLNVNVGVTGSFQSNNRMSGLCRSQNTLYVHPPLLPTQPVPLPLSSIVNNYLEERHTSVRQEIPGAQTLYGRLSRLTTSPGFGLVFCSAMGGRGRTEKQGEWRQLMHISSRHCRHCRQPAERGGGGETDSTVASSVSTFLLF